MKFQPTYCVLFPSLMSRSHELQVPANAEQSIYSRRAYLRTEIWTAWFIHFSKTRTRENNPTPETHQKGQKRSL